MPLGNVGRPDTAYGLCRRDQPEDSSDAHEARLDAERAVGSRVSRDLEAEVAAAPKPDAGKSDLGFVA